MRSCAGDARPQGERVAVRALLGAQLALHAVDPLGRDARGIEQAYGGHAVVALLILGPHATLIDEPHHHVGQLLRRAREQLVCAFRRASAGERDVHGTMIAARRAQLAQHLLGRAHGDRLGVRARRQPRHGSIAWAAFSAGT